MSGNTRPYKYCIVPRCTSTTIATPEKTFISVPRDAKLRRKWCDAMKRILILSHKSSRYCCEDHFDLEKDIANYMEWKMMGGKIQVKKGVMPHKFDCQQSPSRHVGSLKSKPRTIVTPIQSQPSTSSPKPIEWVDCGFINIETGPPPLTDTRSDKDNNLSPSDKIKVTGKHELSKQTQTSDESTETVAPIMTLSIKEILNTRDRNSLSKWDQSTLKTEAENDSDTESDHEYNSIMLKATKMSIEKKPKLYVGIPEAIYRCYLEKLYMKIPATHEDILIALKKIRLNEPYMILAMQFAKSAANIRQIVRQTIPLMAEYFQELLKGFSTISFGDETSSKVQFIIDCFEIQIEKPSNPVYQSVTWSEQSKCNTVKYMISCTTDGLVNFVSSGFGGGISDTLLFQKSGFIKNVSAGVEVVTDRSFENIDNLLAQNQRKLKVDVIESKRKSCLLLHVEGVIARLREFKMLLPHACIDSEHLSFLDEIVMIACGLLNLQKSMDTFQVTTF